MSEAAPSANLLRGPEALRLAVITGGVALHAVSIYVVATIMPLVVGEIGGLPFFAWTATLYIVGSLCGASAVAFSLFLSGSLVCSLAPNMGVLLVGRVLQGLGGGMLPSLGYAIIRLIFVPALHARAIAIMGSVWGIAAVVGPTVGGVFAEFGNWRGAFWVDVLIGAAFIAVSERALPRATGDGVVARPFPGIRLALLGGAAMCVSAGGATGAVVPCLAGIAAALALIVAMLRVDAASRPRLLPGGAFNPAVGIGAISATLGMMIIATSPASFVPYLLRTGVGASPLLAGYVYGAFALAWTIASLVAAQFGARGVRAAIAGGPFVMFVGLALLAWAIPAASVAGVVTALTLLGGGIGISWPHLGALMMQVVPPAERDVAGPFITTTQTMAAVFGSSLAGMTANLAGMAVASTPAEIAEVGRWLFGAMSLAPLLACLLAWRSLYLVRDAR